jgi:DNA invertase Pin-like site-specific DNA recombinase
MCTVSRAAPAGMKGSISEFELGIIRSRMYDAARSKARRGELKISAPIGYSRPSGG